MKIGLIGFGSIGQRHYENLKRHTKDIVVFSKRKDIGLNNVVSAWSDFAKRGSFDAIFITNETYKHLPTVKKCLVLKPKAIFVEKPLSHDSRGLQFLLKNLKKKKISLWVGYNLQFYKPLLRIKKIIRSQKLGKIYYLRVSAGQNLREWRKRDYRTAYSAKKNQGGGVLLDLIHEINYPGWLLEDALTPKTAIVKKLSSLKITAEDFSESIFVSEKKRVVVSVHQDYLRFPAQRYLEISGEKGSLTWDSTGNIINTQNKRDAQKEKIISDRNEMYQKELKFFLDSVKKEKFFTNVKEAIRDIINVERLKKISNNYGY